MSALFGKTLYLPPKKPLMTHSRRISFPLLPIMLLTGVLLWMATGCAHKDKSEPLHTVLYDTTGLRNGDLLFRTGHGYESRVVTNLSAGNFSHIGIAYHDGKQWCVVHAVPGEAAKGEPEYLKCEPVGEFFCPDRAKAGARARVNCGDSIADVASQHALQLVQRKVLFDNHYDLDDTSTLYCTELVRLIFADCGIDLCEDRWHRVPIHTNGPVVFPEDIWNSPLLTDKIIFENQY